MRIAAVTLTNVRCHKHLHVDFEQSVCVLWGPNGIGKTTVLEALALALTGRSPRTHRSTDLITKGADYLRVEAIAESEREGRKIHQLYAVALSHSGEKRFSLEGRRIESPARLAAKPQVVGFFPDSLLTVKGGPERRRELVDQLAALYVIDYSLSLARYQEALGQRNAMLLRRARNEEFEPWEAILAEEGIRVAASRKRTLASFAPTFARILSRLIERPEQGIRLTYRTNVAEFDEEAYRNTLREQRELDLQRGFTHTGPHRDDIVFFLGDVDVRRSGSQGEQRMVQLALVLATAHMVVETTDTPPIMLLDDVMSELDSKRRRALVTILFEGGQTILTSTDLHHFEENELAQMALINLGQQEGFGRHGTQ